MNEKFPQAAPVFHVLNRNENNVLSKAVLRQAQKLGKLNLSDKHLVDWPEEIFILGEVHSENNETDFEEKKGESLKWWELEPLKYLDLSSNSLKTIPVTINQLDSLCTLLLQQNLINSLPHELGQLKNLVKLDLSHNKLDNVPDAIIGLKELRKLNLAHNFFKIFPEPLYDLVMLKNLDLSHNTLEIIKPGIGFLTRLINLNLSYNKLSSIPNDIVNCQALKELNLSNNRLTSSGVPELCDMHHLEILQVQYNLISCLPKLRGCSELKEIHLGFNEIEILIPDDSDQELTIEELSTLTHLQTINLRNNSLRKLPRELSCLQNLIRLDLSNNDLKELPATLSLLPHLETLLVDGNSLRTIRKDIINAGTHRLLAYLKQLLPPEELEKKFNAHFPCAAGKEFPDRFTMRCSRSLTLTDKKLCDIPKEVFEEAVAVPCTMIDISKNKFSEVPSGVWLLCKTLNDLNLSHNQLKEIPGEIQNCLNLRYLNLANNQLKSLPDEFSNCNKMKELNISFNCLEEIPDCIHKLLGLEILLLNDNKINNINAEHLLCLKVLTTLDLTNNDLSNVPPLLGKMTQLHNLGLNGNGLRALRPATIAKGTEAILAWLRNKIV